MRFKATRKWAIEPSSPQQTYSCWYWSCAGFKLSNCIAKEHPAHIQVSTLKVPEDYQHLWHKPKL